MHNGEFICKKCGSDILCITVTFPIHDSPFALSGFGRTKKQMFPYCPECEDKPKIKGLPIKI